MLAEGARRREASAEPEENGSDEESASSLVEVATAPAEEEIVPGGIWSQARIAVSEMLFGDGEIVPGGSQRTLDMVSSFGLSKDANVLNIGAGLGGAARAIAVEYFAWVEGFESDPALAAAGGKYNAGGKKGEKSPADKANIHHVNFETLELKPNVFDGAFSRETFFRVKKSRSSSSQFARALNHHAHFCSPIIFSPRMRLTGLRRHGGSRRNMVTFIPGPSLMPKKY